ncbi:hypothetical protein TBLA_0C01240 [Henningerozyma blattae CBS 6284]|uniref:Amino acid permease/ SLC12A domain-containing protein n=1 Tax=Henningerozyma blattae (strain ATCC 34711 / CBS 6284 / DSM 70876 / NBRC 10599 / NRRL Y-10934 / UCD 77-7) TaxID=1071380 RepID=I2H0N7_HENB6|nr:hypothetical protein TBLA_0C01240 [Tetrapisispora blattae CBS 6284]CCH59939.1 hypothetical protein TBLA_0C01240 [Tetrapisispora blattae CBS 6284]
MTLKDNISQKIDDKNSSRNDFSSVSSNTEYIEYKDGNYILEYDSNSSLRIEKETLTFNSSKLEECKIEDKISNFDLSQIGYNGNETIISEELINEDGRKNKLKQGLNARHIQLIALGGCIGTGLFVGAGITLNKCGPAGLVASYLIISTMVYPIMNVLGEMVCYLPGDGSDSAGSVPHLVKRYLDDSLSFAAGWNYYYCFVMLVAAECTAASGVVEYWTKVVPKPAWIVMFQLIIFGLNMCPVRVYGESEFWFAISKILCIVGLIILSFILFWGGGPNHDRLGFRYWITPGSFANTITNGSFGNFLDVYKGIILGAFSFILGPELVVLPSSECSDPRRNIKKASKRFIWRLMFFYILGTLSISVIVSYNDPILSTALIQDKPGAGSSPFVIGIQNAGIDVLPHIINVCILISAWSSGNAYLFASSRSLQTMAINSQAPKCLGKINRFGVPYVAVIVSIILSCIAYLNCSKSTSDVFKWFTNLSTISGFLGWIIVSVTYLRFRKAIEYHGMKDRLPYTTWGQPYLIIYSLISFIIITITNGFDILIPRNWNVSDFIAAYLTLPIFLMIWIGHKFYKYRFKIFTRQCRWWYQVEDIDVITGLEEIEMESEKFESEYVKPETVGGKFVDWLL